MRFTARPTHSCPFGQECPPAAGKPRYRLVSTTADGLYYFVNVNTSGIQREHYSIRRSEFWGRLSWPRPGSPDGPR